jgi:hypothetical protein
MKALNMPDTRAQRSEERQRTENEYDINTDQTFDRRSAPLDWVKTSTIVENRTHLQL